MSTSIDLSLLPAPDAVETVDYERILQQRKDRLISLTPDADRPDLADTLELESEPLTVQLQESSYREMVLRQRINEAARASLLAFARDGQLDHIGARYYVYRLVVQEADPSAVPPKARVMESDDAFLERIQMAYEGLSVAGPSGAYEFHARSADGRVLDAKAHTPAPADVEVAVLSAEDGDGTASADLQQVVNAALNDEEIRPLGDRVTIRSAQIINYAIRARLHMQTSGPGRDQAVANAKARMSEFAYRRRRLGQSVWLSKIDSLLHVEGVERVEIVEPAANLILSWFEAGRCVEVDVHDADQTVLDAP
ncbi:baseplate assembly protein [Alcaligenaceae bacterium SJ-26]|nr:baseplate assembly protein [Alcaligenaceae bacterium SJ-26]